MRKEVFGSVELYCGDCMDYMAGLPDKAFDLAIVDPPYGIGTDRGTEYVKRKIDTSKRWDTAPPQEYFQELFRVSKEQIIWGGNYFALPIRKSWICWYKTKQIEGRSWADFELAWTSLKIVSRFYEYPPFVMGNERIHPTQKPVALYKWLLSQYAKPGWRILDTHGGSFSSAVAAYELGYEYIGIELDEDYYTAAVERMKRVASQPFLVKPQSAFGQAFEFAV
jgi:site-specific DNA-methyltransferase (adenine-specific)